MNISEVARTVGLPVKTVRYYADIDLVAPISRNAAGYRQYDDTSVRKLTFIKRARSFGFSVKECRELLGLYEDKDRSSADVRTIARAKGIIGLIVLFFKDWQKLNLRITHRAGGLNKPQRTRLSI